MVFTGNGVWVRDISGVAWEQALHLGDIMKSRCARGMWEETRKQREGERKESLQRSLINFHSRTPHQSVKTVTANVPQIGKMTVKFRQLKARIIYLFIKSLLQQLSTASKQMFFTTDVFFIHWTSNVNVSTQIRTHYFYKISCFVYIWKVVHIQRTISSPSQSPSLYNCPFRNWRTAFSCTWFSYVLLQLLHTLSIVLLDSQLLILCQLCCHVHVSEFFYPVEFKHMKKPTLEG